MATYQTCPLFTTPCPTHGEDEVTPAQGDESYDVHLAQSFVPTAIRSMTEQEAARQSVQQRQSGQSSSASSTVMWPSIGGAPINEFTTEGYFSCAFPTLFPTGAADFLGQRQNQVTIGNYFKQLIPTISLHVCLCETEQNSYNMC